MSLHQLSSRALPPTNATHAVTRKGAIRTRPRSPWTTDMDEIEFARESLHTGMASTRDGFTDVRSVANVVKLSSLQAIFPTVAFDILTDVLIAAQFRVDMAASMLSELSRELHQSTSSGDGDAPELIDEDWASIEENDEGNNHWHDVSESRPELQQWVIVPDEWEVVEGVQVTTHETIRSYADALLSSSGSRTNEPTLLQQLPSLTRVEPSKFLTKSKSQKSEKTDGEEELCGKSFGARKRRFMRKNRSPSATKAPRS